MTTAQATSRREREQIARRLRAEGLKMREVAERMRVSVSTVDAWLNDPGGKRLAARKRSYAGTCVDCGTPTDGSDGPGRARERCVRCTAVHLAPVTRERQRAQWADHRVMIEAMWADGLTISEIREATGIESFNPGPYRQRGYDLPHRRSDEQRARIRAGRWPELAA